MIMDDLENLIKKMTLEEKAALCTGASPWTTVAIDRLKIPSIAMADGPHGVRKCTVVSDMGSVCFSATCFPTASCLAASWDRDLMYMLGQALADEAMAQNVDVLLGPGVNMKRSPLCGRNFEYFSEDPFLAGELAASYINGLQEKGVGATIKHFAANNQETKRFVISAEIDERTLREVYLPAFETAIKKSNPWAVMCAYNRLNGIPCSEHTGLLTHILRDEWGYDGLVMSDWGAVQDRVNALNAGLDLEMPGPRPGQVQSIVHAVKSGALDEAVLDRAVSRILSFIEKASTTPNRGEFDYDGHHELAARIAAEGMVLLKNNGILPLKKFERIAVIGLPAKKPYYQGGGASHVNPTKVSIPYDELKKQAPDTIFTYADGYTFDGKTYQALIDEAVENALSADIAILFISLPPMAEAEGSDRSGIDLSPHQIRLIWSLTTVQPNTVIVLNNGAPVAMSEWIDGAAAVLEAWMPGQAGGKAIADIIFGHVNPSGKLAETFPLKLPDTPAYIHWPGEGNIARYGEGLFIGYRYYDTKDTPVLFPFGHGLSYSSFSYTDPQVSATRFKDIDGVLVSVDVTNTGDVKGKETVQVYIHDRKSALIRPYKELKGFTKVELRPDETQTISIMLDFRAFAYYHPIYKRWITENGDFDILIGSSSGDIRQSVAVTLQSTLDLHNILDYNSTLREWLEDTHGRAVIEPLLKVISEEMDTIVETGESVGIPVGENKMDTLMDMPLFMIFNFFEGQIPTIPDKLTKYLLKKIYG